MPRRGGFAGVFALMVWGVPFLPASDRRAEKRCLADRWGSLGGAGVRQIVERWWRDWSLRARYAERGAPVRIIAWPAPAQKVSPANERALLILRNESASHKATRTVGHDTVGHELAILCARFHHDKADWLALFETPEIIQAMKKIALPFLEGLKTPVCELTNGACKHERGLPFAREFILRGRKIDLLLRLEVVVG